MPFLVSLTFYLAFALTSYFAVTFAFFCLRYAIRGRTWEHDPKYLGSSVVLNELIRNYFVWASRPLFTVLIRAGITPNAVTGASVFFAIAAGFAVAAGEFVLGGWLYLACGTCDFLDGRLARATNTMTNYGAALDSILDRYCEAAMLIGLAWFYRDNWALLVFLLFLTGSFLVPYIRARGEAVGVATKVGVMQRAERMVTLGAAILASPVIEYFSPQYAALSVRHALVVAVALLLTISTQITALHRFAHLIRELKKRSPTPDDSSH